MDGLVRKMGIGIGWDIDNSGLVKANNHTDGLVDSANRGSSSFKGLSNAGFMAGNTIRRAFNGAKKAIVSGVNWLEDMRYKLAGVAAAGGAAILGLVNQAGKAEETMSKFQVVFGDFANETLDWAGDFSKAVGQSELDTARWLSGFQDLLIPMGFTRKEATELSKQFTKTGVDLGAFTDETISTEDAMRKMQAGITGEREGLKQLGIVIDESDIKNIAYREGLIEQGAELTKQQKAIATYMGIVEQSQDAIGQAQETQNQWSRRMEAFRGILKDLSTEMGGIFMPTVSRGLGLVNDFLYSLRESKTLKIAAGFLTIVTVITGLGAAIGTISFLWGKLTAIAVTAGTTVVGLIAPYLLAAAAIIGLGFVIEDLWIGFQGGKSVIFDAIDWFLDLIGVSYDMADLVPLIAEGWDRGFNLLKNIIFGFVKIIYHTAGLISGAILSLFTLDISYFKDQWNELLESVQQLADRFFGLFGTSTERIAGFFSRISDTIDDWRDNIIGWFADNFDFGGLIRTGLESAIDILPGFLQDKAKGLLGFDDDRPKDDSRPKDNDPGFIAGQQPGLTKTTSGNEEAEREIEREAQTTQKQIQNNSRSVTNSVSVGEIKVEAADNPKETGKAVRKELETFLGMEAAEVGV